MLNMSCFQKEIKDEKYLNKTKLYKTQYEYYESKKEESLFKIYEDKKDESGNKFPPIFKPPVFAIYEDVCVVSEVEEAANVVLGNLNEKDEEIVHEKQITTEKSIDREQDNLKADDDAADTASNCNFAAIHSSLNDICQANIEDKSQDESYSKDNYKDSPMSVGTLLEKSFTYSSSSNEEYRTRRASFKELRNSFFEVEEYRNDIHNYLRVSEVCLGIFFLFYLYLLML